MRDVETIIVGGGPAGSSCAKRLKALGREVLLLDRAPFPRPKLCAGWITPAVVADLDLDLGRYPHRLLAFDQLHFHYRKLHLALPARQYSIRRYEFDHYLLTQSGAEVIHHTVKRIEAVADGYLIDNQFKARYLVGAGGTSCPVYRALFKPRFPRPAPKQIVTLELEFAYQWQDAACHLWFCENRLPGYAWYVPKADGYLNIGIGGFADQIKQRGSDIKQHWSGLARKLQEQGLVSCELLPSGYSYFLRWPLPQTRLDNAFVIGDAAGLATTDMGEGIGPAVRSGLLAAEAIVDGGDYSRRTIAARNLPTLLGTAAQRAVGWRRAA